MLLCFLSTPIHLFSFSTFLGIFSHIMYPSLKLHPSLSHDIRSLFYFRLSPSKRFYFCYIHLFVCSLPGVRTARHHSSLTPQSYAVRFLAKLELFYQPEHQYLFVILSPFVVHFAFPPLFLPRPLFNSTFRMLFKIALRGVRLLLNT